MELAPNNKGQRGGGHHGGDDSTGRFGFDLNIDNYSTDDLLEIYKINKNQKGNITEDYVKKMTDEIVGQYKNYNAMGLGGDMPFSDNYSARNLKFSSWKFFSVRSRNHNTSVWNITADFNWFIS